jgi:hypothetical protein
VPHPRRDRHGAARPHRHPLAARPRRRPGGALRDLAIRRLRGLKSRPCRCRLGQERPR